MRRNFAVLAVAAMALAVMCGAAWADANAVATKINGSALGGSGGLTATASGSTVTVTGTKEIEKTGTDIVMLDLGDLSGVTIDWKANLTVIAGDKIHDNGNTIFAASGSGTFNMLDGKIEIVSTPNRKTKQVWVFAGDEMKYVLSGGIVSGDHAGDCGFGTAAGSITLDGATVYFPNGHISVMVPTIIKNDIKNVTGVSPTGLSGDPQKRGFEMFGKITYDAIKSIEDLQEENAHFNIVINKGAEVTFTITDLSNAKTTLGFVVEGTVNFTGLKAKIEKLTVNPGGVAVLDENCEVEVVNGEVKSKAASSSASVSAQATTNANYGILEVNGKLTVPAGGSLTVENVNGLVLGSGAAAKISLSGGTLHLPKDITDEQIKAIGLDPNDSNIKRDADTGGDTSGGSSSGACDAGFGLAALAALAMVMKRRSK